jgi:hypothetical protein
LETVIVQTRLVAKTPGGQEENATAHYPPLAGDVNEVDRGWYIPDTPESRGFNTTRSKIICANKKSRLMQLLNVKT